MPLTDMRGEPVVPGRWYWARRLDNSAHVTGQMLKQVEGGISFVIEGFLNHPMRVTEGV